MAGAELMDLRSSTADSGARGESDAGRRAWPRIDVVLLSWRNGSSSAAALQAVAHSSYPNLRIIVVDNASDDGSDAVTWAALCRFWPGAIRVEQRENRVDAARLAQRHRDQCARAEGSANAVYIQSHRNRGYAGGMNLGLQFSDAVEPAAYFCLLANDVLVRPDAFEHLVRRCEADPRIGLCGATQHRLDERGDVVCSVPGGVRFLPALGWSMGVRCPAVPSAQRTVERRMNALQGSAVFGTREFLDQVGLMATDRFVYFEESDWARRGRELGFRLGWAPAAVIQNQNNRTMVGYGTRLERLEAAHYLMARAGVVFTRQHYPKLLPLVVAARLVRSAEDAVRKGPTVGRHSLAGLIDAFTGRHRRFAVLGDALLPTDLDVDSDTVLPSDGGGRDGAVRGSRGAVA